MSASTNSRQTVSYLTRRFREVGIDPVARHGQNFLIDMNLLQLLADRAELTRDDVVLEIGTGAGSLTALLAQRAGHVVTVEIDRRMFQLASEELVDVHNVTMLPIDALRNKNQLDERVLGAVNDALAAAPGRQFKVAANLPYNVATPILTNLLVGPLIPRSMTVTIQKEVADRLVAQPGSKDYGSLSIWVQSQCRVELTRVMNPTVFWPRPKVHSAIVHLEFDDALRQRLVDPARFHSFVRGLFLHRRKLLRGVLASMLKEQVDKPRIDALMERQGLSPHSRAEELTVEQMIALSDAVTTIQ